MSGFVQDEFVRHTGKPKWGTGKVLEVMADNKLRIFFSEEGEKKLNSLMAPLERVDPSEDIPASLIYLKTNKGKAITKFTSMKQLKALFLSEFEEGFHGSEYYENERGYKEKGVESFSTKLDREQFAELLAAGDYSQLWERARYVINKTNLIHPFEKTPLAESMKDERHHKAFATALFDLLYGEGEYERRFMAFANQLGELNAPKWTIATYFPYLHEPGRYLFMKPTYTQSAADICAFEINYKSSLNWLTYKSVLAFGEYLFKELRDMNPKDMIDVQSFIWCTARISMGEYTKSPPAENND